MNRYILIRRLTGPCILLLLGVVALLHEADLVSWNIFVPLLLILIGVLKLAQRAALAVVGDEPMYPGSPYPYGAGAVPTQPPPQAGTQTGASIIPAPPQDFGAKDFNEGSGGRS
ncbi:MAG TPA: hypothetical protein VK720_14890 [Terracidiphilus sp.]|jgi:hypothetical protein|nr:hypothetical protein [Terracidiphilus sp.]